MHRSAVRISLRFRKLLLSGPHPGRYPRTESCHGPMHRLQVLPQEVTSAAAHVAAFLFPILTDEKKNSMILEVLAEMFKKPFAFIHNYFIYFTYDKHV